MHLSLGIFWGTLAPTAGAAGASRAVAHCMVLLAFGL
jgi:hypothetical protein